MRTITSDWGSIAAYAAPTECEEGRDALRNHGVMVLDVSCDQLAASRMEKYVAVKRGGLP
ncbi:MULTISPECIES: hypothetical protein [unclassified Lysobacter]|uniref:hypothetical protein n=1 Tax=unclassified Lysobacter TaxID=2635362 RepID=UPI0006FBB6A7|nr:MULTISPECIES: hypothetical protein [unclassified Lysobacter]KRD70425.1 hypothetical protein ASE45_00695 [Lysobacter sp. Root96]